MKILTYENHELFKDPSQVLMLHCREQKNGK